MSELRHIWVAIAGFYILLVESGMRQVLNIFAETIRTELNCSRQSADTAIIVLPTASSLISGPFVAVLYQLFGARKTIFIGSILVFFGFYMGSYVNSINYMYLTSLSLGIGFGLLRNSIVSVQCEYFTEHRNVVLSLITIGPGVGMFCLPRIIVTLLTTFSWRITWRILSVLYTVTMIFGLFISRKAQPAEHTTLYKLSGIKMYTNISFVFHSLSCVAATMVSITYISYILPLMKENQIPSPELVYSLHGVASIVGKVFLSVVISNNLVPLPYVMVCNYIIAQCSMSAASFCTLPWHFQLQNIFVGFGVGLFQASLFSFLLEMTGSSNLATALGFTNLINGVSAFAGVSLSGAVSSHFSSLRSVFKMSFVLTLLAILSSIVTSILMVRDAHRREKQKEQEPVNDVALRRLTANCEP